MQILLLTSAPPQPKPSPTAARCRSAAQVLPNLQLLDHQVRIAPYDTAALLRGSVPDVVLVDALSDLVTARGTCRLLRSAGLAARLIAVLAEGGLAGMSTEWGVDDFVLRDAGPAEVDARLRLANLDATARVNESSAPETW